MHKQKQFTLAVIHHMKEGLYRVADDGTQTEDVAVPLFFWNLPSTRTDIPLDPSLESTLLWFLSYSSLLMLHALGRFLWKKSTIADPFPIRRIKCSRPRLRLPLQDLSRRVVWSAAWTHLYKAGTTVWSSALFKDTMPTNEWEELRIVEDFIIFRMSSPNGGAASNVGTCDPGVKSSQVRQPLSITSAKSIVQKYSNASGDCVVVHCACMKRGHCRTALLRFEQTTARPRALKPMVAYPPLF